VSQKSAVAVAKAAENLKFNFNIREVSIVQLTFIVTEAVVVQEATGELPWQRRGRGLLRLKPDV